MTSTNALPQASSDAVSAACWYGAYPAIVIDIRDPEARGRVKVTLPWAPSPDGQRYEAWARLATLMAGNNRGTWFVPEVNDEVLVVFQGGDPRVPFVIGSMWNGVDTPPSVIPSSGDNSKRILRSPSGVTVTLDETKDSCGFSVETPGGARLAIHDLPDSCVLTDDSGNCIKMNNDGRMTIEAVTELHIKSSANVTVTTSDLTVNSPLSKFTGVVKAETVMANNMVSQSYTPAAGNIW